MERESPLRLFGAVWLTAGYSTGRGMALVLFSLKTTMALFLFRLLLMMPLFSLSCPFSSIALLGRRAGVVVVVVAHVVYSRSLHRARALALASTKMNKNEEETTRLSSSGAHVRFCTRGSNTDG